MHSLTARLLIGATIVLASFLGVTGYTLDRVFRDAAETAVRERLQGHIWTLIASAQIRDDGSIHLLRALPEAPFNQPGSGLYAQIVSNDSRHRWRSPSLEDARMPVVAGLTSAEHRFERQDVEQGQDLFIYSFGVTWDQKDMGPEGYTFSVAETSEAYRHQVGEFQRHLWTWLGGVALVLLAVQGTILRWSLAPLRRAADEIADIEAGVHTSLKGRYPREMRGLTDNLNALIVNNREHLERYRHALDDLAHSLNTPLALLRGAVEVEQPTPALRENVREQVDRMSDIVNYQLRRAATSGRTALTAPVVPRTVAEKIVATLDKVYAEKAAQGKVDIPAGLVFHGDQGDLYELLGNLLDNAYKWCRGNVRVAMRPSADLQTGKHALRIVVEDDGPGIPDGQGVDVTQRGVRADQATGGHGIGLTIVNDIVKVYGGNLMLERSDLGGAKITVVLPNA